jgi:threonine dehydratase
VERIVVVDDEEIKHAMRMLWERLRAVVEPSGAVSFAAALKDAQHMRDHKVGIIVSGGNVDLDKIPFLQ